MTDILEQLLPASWRGLQFPVVSMRSTIAHDLVEHKYWGVDGARVEATGLAPCRHSFRVPFINGLKTGHGETWSDLYPNHLRRVAIAFQDKKTGVLQHPEFGEIACKAERFEIDWSSERRGGVDAELSFVETIVEGDTDKLTFPSPVKEVDLSASELDGPTMKADLKALLKAKGLELPPYLLDKEPFSFTDAMNAIKKVTDYPALVSRRAGGKIDSVVYQAQRVEQSVAGLRSALTWPVTQNVERVKAAAHDMNETLIAGSRTVRLFTVPHDTTIAGVVRQIRGAKVGDIVKLNPGLMIQPEIRRGTVVRHYAAAA